MFTKLSSYDNLRRVKDVRTSAEESSSCDEEEEGNMKLKLNQKKRNMKRQKMHKTDDETDSN